MLASVDEWSAENQNKINEYMMTLNVVEENRIETNYAHVLQQWKKCPLSEIESKINTLTQQIKEEKQYLLTNSFLLSKKVKVIKENILDLKYRKKALQNIKKKKTVMLLQLSAMVP